MPPPSLQALLQPQWIEQYERAMREGCAKRVNDRVAARFGGFIGRLRLTTAQRQDAMRKVEGIAKRLNADYWGIDSATEHVIVAGSWGKATQGRPPRDVDLLFELPYWTYQRFERRQGNRQSQLLQEVKESLETTYRNTRMRGDGQVVVVGFQDGHGVEVVPGFLLQNGQYWICDTNDDGSYRVMDPRAEISAIDESDRATGCATRELIRMVKRWQCVCNVPIDSFQLELVAIDFLRTVPYRIGTRALDDWLVRDFFGYLTRQANSFVLMPGTLKLIWLGADWLSRAQTAWARAARASMYEEREMPAHALDPWRAIFGDDIE